MIKFAVFATFGMALPFVLVAALPVQAETKASPSTVVSTTKPVISAPK